MTTDQRFTVDGELPTRIDGQDFRTEAARLLDTVRTPARMAVVDLSLLIDLTRSDEMLIALERRSALQFRDDDFRGTLAGGLVDELARELADHLSRLRTPR